MKNRKNRLVSMLALAGAVPFYARYVGEGAGGSGNGDGSAGAGAAEGSAGGEGAAGEAGSEEGDKKDPPSPAVVEKKVYDATLSEAIRRKKENEKLAAELAALKQNAPSADELAELRQFKIDQEKKREEDAKKRGDYEKLLADQKKAAAEEKARLEAEAKAKDAKYRRERIGNALSMEIPKYTAAPVRDVARLFEDCVSVADDDSFVINKDGQWPLDPVTGKEITLARFIETEIESREWLARHKPAGGSGSATNGGKGSGKGGQITPGDLGKMSHADFMKNRDLIMSQATANTRAMGAGA